MSSHSTNGDKVSVPSTDPSVYEHLKGKWNKLPTGEEDWINRARDVAEVLAHDVVKRDKENRSPRAEIALLKYSGLLKVLGPRKYGGGGQAWDVGYKTIREVAKADGYASTRSLRSLTLTL